MADKKGIKGKKNDDDNLPGYPHYPENEDLLSNNAERIDVDIENLSRAVDPNTTIKENTISDSSTASKNTTATIPPDPEGEIELVPGNEADVNEEDIMALGDIGLSPDGGDDQILMQHPVRAGDSQLDIPGAELDDAAEAIGDEDEENNYYSLGGDENDNLEDDSMGRGI